MNAGDGSVLVFTVLLFWLCANRGRGSFTDFLLVADKNKSSIYIGSLYDFDLSPLPIANTTAPVAVDFDPVHRMVYWTDYMDTMILRARLDGSQRQVLVDTGLVDPGGLALDPKARLMFWTDGYPHNNIERASMDGGDRRVVVREGPMHMPRAIVLDQRQGHVYWATLDTQAAIKRSDYEGRHRFIIVERSLKWPNGIALDLKGGWLYWCDAYYKVFEKCDLRGNNRQVVLRENRSHPFGLALYGDSLLWTDWGADWLLRWDMTQKQFTTEGPPIFAQATGIHVHTARDFLLVADRNKSSIYMGSLYDFDLSPLPIANTTAPVAVDFDPVHRMVYWTDYMDTMILRARLDGSQRRILVDTGLADPGGLALDCEARLMFWTDGHPHNRVEQASMDGDKRRVIISDSTMPRAIALDQQERHVYWSSLGLQAAITRADYDGGNRVVLVDGTLRWPNGVALDRRGGWLYWCDAYYKVFEKCDLRGNNRQVVLRENRSHPFGLALYGDSLLWTDWRVDSLLRWDMTQKQLTTEGPPIFAQATGIRVHTAEDLLDAPQRTTPDTPTDSDVTRGSTRQTDQSDFTPTISGVPPSQPNLAMQSSEPPRSLSSVRNIQILLAIWCSFWMGPDVVNR